MNLLFLESFLVNDAVPTLRLGGGSFAIGLRGPAALPETPPHEQFADVANDPTLQEALAALDIDPGVVIDARIAVQAEGMNVLMVAARAMPLPSRGAAVTIAGVPLQVAYVQQLPVDLPEDQ
jgi:hypothetical protein